jgi:putative transposase
VTVSVDAGGAMRPPMPWKELCTLGVREEFVLKALEPDGSFAGLCEQYGISRKTGYKWLSRYKRGGVAALEGLSRRPNTSPLRVSADVVTEVVRIRKAHRRRGAKKIAVQVRQLFGDEAPSVRTVARILERTGMLQPMRRRKKWPKVVPLRPSPTLKAPNDLWTVDFKGWWLCGDGRRCEPLTIRDAFSRYVLAIVILPSNSWGPVRAVFEELFEKHGVPKAIQSDNGPPFASPQSWHGLSSLSVWWMEVGIQVFRSRPGKPQDNGGHERMHRDMAEELEAYAAMSKDAQQRECDRWRHDFNHHRPHEALGMKTPSQVYRRSNVDYSAEPPELDYPDNFHERLVGSTGCIRMHNILVFLSTALRRKVVGLEPLGPGRRYTVWFARHRIGVIDFAQERPSLTPQPERAA